MRRRITAGVLVACTAAPAGAQTWDRFSLSTVVSVDHAAGENTADRPNIIADILFTVRLGEGWQIYVRPWIRQPRRAEWDLRLYQAALRWERPGPVALRVDAGYIVSPVGLGLFDSSPSLNPTILPHLTYFVPMPTFDPGAPRVSPIASTYPPGAQLTAATERWDARVALVDSAPTRVYTLGASSPPDHTPALEAGAGITPLTGLRLGVSMAHGAYATADEVHGTASVKRLLSMSGIEAEYAFRYTKLAGEFIYDRFETPFGDAAARTWFVQGQQTLTPRWFAAARHERASAPPLANGVVPGTRRTFSTAEAIVGYRVTRALTLRGGYYGRKNYTAAGWDHQAGASVVWSERWR